jgi:hypothetical protein
MKAAYIYILKQTTSYLHKPLNSTGLPPHFSIAVDKSTPHRDTNQAIMLIFTVNGKRVSMPNAPLVYEYGREEDSDEDSIMGGYGVDLIEQIVAVLKASLQLTDDDLSFLRGKNSILTTSIAISCYSCTI